MGNMSKRFVVPINRIKGLLESKNWTQEILARKAGSHPSYICCILAGKCDPGPIICVKIAKVLRVDSIWLWGGLPEDGRRNPDQQERIRLAKLLRQDGVTYREIGEQLGISKQRVCQLVNDCP